MTAPRFALEAHASDCPATAVGDPLLCCCSPVANTVPEAEYRRALGEVKAQLTAAKRAAVLVIEKARLQGAAR